MMTTQGKAAVTIFLLALLYTECMTQSTSDSPSTNTQQSPGTSAANTHAEDEEEKEYPPFDGWYNNLANPDWGGAERALFRKVPPVYSDGVYEPVNNRPNPSLLADTVFEGDTGHPSEFNRTAFLVFFGQQVVEEILDVQRPGCPPEYFNINLTSGEEMPFLRSRYDMNTGFSPNNPRQQLNEISPYIDGSLFYGPNKAWTDAIRLFRGGRLAAMNDTDPSAPYFPRRNNIRLPYANPPPPIDHPNLEKVDRFFSIGNPRGNENPFLLTFGVLWFRYHNYRARQVEAKHPDWTDEKVFLEARRLTMGVYQKIVIKDWLPSWLSGPPTATECKNRPDTKLEPYEGYDASVNPQISHLFQTSAMRFGHTLVPPGVYRRKRTSDPTRCEFHGKSLVKGFEGHKKALRTCNTYWRSGELVTETGIEDIILGMSSQITEREDRIITPDLRGSVFGPLEFNRRDLMAINIQRGRDHGLTDYNTAREAFRLPRVTNYNQINPSLTSSRDREVLQGVRELYKDHGGINNVDVFVGGMLETTKCGPGHLFRKIILDQFRRIRAGDRFWYENYEYNKLYTKAEVNEIDGTRIIDVIRAVTNITSQEIQDNPFFHNAGDPCPQMAQLNGSDPDLLEPCTPRGGFDYFTGSEISYILSFLALAVVLGLTIGALFLLVWLRNRKTRLQKKAIRQRTLRNSGRVGMKALTELVEKNEERDIWFLLDTPRRSIQVKAGGKVVRLLDMKLVAASDKVTVILSADRYNRLLVIRMPKEYDLILKFDSLIERESVREDLLRFLEDCHVEHQLMAIPETTILKEANTKQARKKQLESFFRVTFAHAFKYDADNEFEDMSSKDAKMILGIELTKEEFAEALALKPTSLFVENMFNLADVDQSGYVSFREFLDVIVIFAKGTAEDKTRLLFDMYDINRTGRLSKDEFKAMLKSMMEMNGAEVDPDHMDQLLGSMFKGAGLENRHQLTFEDFSRILESYENELNYVTINLDGADVKTPEISRRRRSAAARASVFHQAYYSQEDEIYSPLHTGTTDPNKRKSVLQNVKTLEKKYPTTQHQTRLMSVIRYIENYKLHIFWLALYTLVTIGIFAERAYYYSVEREHAGLRRIAGYGVTVTRGAASGMMFTYSCLLVTMCRNTITFLRETFLHRYIPFDSNIAMHKYIAGWALFFTLMHCIGHGINFYHISTQTANDLSCLFRDFFHSTHQLPKFHRWCWQTITGVTGVLLTILTMIMYTFAIQYARRHVYKAFWFTHNLYPVFFLLTILHGSGNLVQPPFFHFFFLGPVILFVLDQLVSASRKKVEIPVVSAELLPSAVTYLEFKRPLNFEYKSGQWVRIACLAHSPNEYHPFTLTSAPHEDTLKLHIRAVGPWTNSIRNIYNKDNLRNHFYPKLYLDGPFGEGHQDWYKYDVSVMVGGGIGVTPFASILKSLVSMSKTGTTMVCKKVYFIWVTRTQKHFEWMTDIIREVEETDINDLVSVHIFITQFRQKFDLRTTMLYICERHFQKISNRSLFTGLRSITHFGRPNFNEFLQALLDEHKDVSDNKGRIGVFSCGPPPMTKNVERACVKINKLDKASFHHHFENF